MAFWELLGSFPGASGRPLRTSGEHLPGGSLQDSFRRRQAAQGRPSTAQKSPKMAQDEYDQPIGVLGPSLE